MLTGGRESRGSSGAIQAAFLAAFFAAFYASVGNVGRHAKTDVLGVVGILAAGGFALASGFLVRHLRANTAVTDCARLNQSCFCADFRLIGLSAESPLP